MKPNERFVFDTNVLVSGLLFAESKPAQAFFLALRTGIFLTSFAALHELRTVLHRKKFDKYLTSAISSLTTILVRPSRLTSSKQYSSAATQKTINSSKLRSMARPPILSPAIPICSYYILFEGFPFFHLMSFCEHYRNQTRNLSH